MISNKRDIRLILDNIRSVHNVGSIFRTAECAGVSRIYCLETTPTPTDRFGRKRKDFSKVSLGAEEMLAWEHASDAVKLVKSLKKEGFSVVAVEQNKNSINYRNIKVGDKTIFILGNEVSGVSTGLLKLADDVAEIPMIGQKESLNVSVTTGIVLFQLLGL